ncbi:MAG: SDR family oxidoreductase [Myxococcota bacterium]|nr:SDR family oxidoreductase [Myxococcota bacterium]
MPAKGVFITGFPGFIAGRLMQDLLERQTAKNHYYFLVQPRFATVARERCEAIEATHPQFAKKWTIVEGDIRERDLGIAPDMLKKIRPKIHRLWHLAAIYDLSVPVSLAYGVNVEGTLHVLDFCETLPKFERLLYISTCYVAGDRTGMIYESDLDKGQDFKNHYESTKFWAEKLVQHRWDKIPTVIFRPAIVVGDSKTGETIKGDGPYVFFNLLGRLPKWIPMVTFGEPTATINVVPVDFLVEAMSVISTQEEVEGKVFQLADPNPNLASELMDTLVAQFGRAPVVGQVPMKLINTLMSLKPIERLAGIQKQSFAYASYPVTYDVSNTLEQLEGSGVSCPQLTSYLTVLLDYFQRHPEIALKVD